MPIYDEVWEEQGKGSKFIKYPDFQFRQQMNLRTLTKNHLGKLSSLKFEFVEYKVFIRINKCLLRLTNCLHAIFTTGCLLIAKINTVSQKIHFNLNAWYALINIYEYLLFSKDARRFFATCLHLNAAYGLAKKYFPEYSIIKN